MAVTKHGLSGSPLYKAWENMRSRAAGGTGCEDVWVTFEGFLMNPPSAGPSPIDGVERDFAPGLCLCRTDDIGPYGPTNCRWDTRRNNSLEQRRRVKLTDEDVAAIRATYEQGSATQRSLAAQFGVAQTQIHNIVRRKQRT